MSDLYDDDPDTLDPDGPDLAALDEDDDPESLIGEDAPDELEQEQ